MTTERIKILNSEELLAFHQVTTAKLVLYTAVRKQRDAIEELAGRRHVTQTAARKLVGTPSLE